jgi:hypothetical protein
MSDLTWRRIAFRGLRAVSAPMTWGQRKVVLDMSRWAPGTAYNVTAIVPVPRGSALDKVLASIGEVVGNNEALRTLFHQNTQQVLEAGEVEVGLCQADSPGELMEKARELDRLLEETPFDHAVEPPFRALVCSLGPDPQAVIVCVAHLAADLQGTRLVGEELETLLKGEAYSREALQPVEVAELENSPRGLRREESALRHLRGSLTAFPSANFPARADEPAQPRYWRGALDSSATAPALGVLAARYGTSSSTVALAAVAALIGAVTGEDRCGLMLVVGNRIVGDLRRTVASLTQTVPLLLDLTGPTFADLVRAVWSASLQAAKHGRFDPFRAEKVIEEVAGDRGARPDLDCFFNDMRADTAARPGPPGAAGEFRWADSRATGVDFFVELGNAVGTPGALRWTLLADTRALPKPLIKEFLYGIERLLIKSASRELRLDEARTCVTIS